MKQPIHGHSMKHRTRQPLRRTPDRLTEQGFSIIELLVALAIGMALTVAITLVMMRHEGTRRSLTSSNDSQINANYLGYVLDRNLRSAGTGFAQGWNSTYGCLLHAARNGTQILPRPSGFPAPFSAVNTQLRLAPLIIHAGAGEGNSDVLAVLEADAKWIEEHHEEICQGNRAVANLIDGVTGECTIVHRENFAMRFRRVWLFLGYSGKLCPPGGHA